MFERFPRRTLAATGAALLAAMGIGGAAIAQSNGSRPAKTHSRPVAAQSGEKPGVESKAPENSAKDPDNVQYTAPGDPDYKGAGKARGVVIKSKKAAKRSATPTAEKPGTEQSPASESPGTEKAGNESSSEKAGSEVSGDDGPGGHADEPGNPNADHQFQGQE